MKGRTIVWLAVLCVLVISMPLFAASEGATLYHTNCARCHGEDGAAKTEAAAKMKVANLRSDYVQKQSDQQLFETIGRGTSHKEYPHTFLHRGLSEAQVRSIVAHVRTLRAK